MALDSDGVAWLNWLGSEQVTSFDRRKCDVTNGPTATGKHCPEGWTVYQMDRSTSEGALMRRRRSIGLVGRTLLLGAMIATPPTSAD